nr:uncharacterized protein LOC117440743 [Pseudochaenichthys georgianus]
MDKTQRLHFICKGYLCSSLVYTLELKMDSRRSKRKRMGPPKRLVSESAKDLADQSEEEPCSSHTVAKEMAVVHCSDGSDSDAFTGQQSTVKASTKDVSAAPTAIAALKHRKLENNALKIRIDALKDKVLYLESERDYLRIQLAEALALLKMASVKAPVISEGDQIGAGNSFSSSTSSSSSNSSTKKTKGKTAKRVVGFNKRAERPKNMVDTRKTCCWILKLPQELLQSILLEVVLDAGDMAYLTLSLVCWKVRNTVSQDAFRKKAHFLWILSVDTNWFHHSESYREEMSTMFCISSCQFCRTQFKDCSGYVGDGKRGVIRAMYSEHPHPGFCSHFCSTDAGNFE